MNILIIVLEFCSLTSSFVVAGWPWNLCVTQSNWEANTAICVNIEWYMVLYFIWKLWYQIMGECCITLCICMFVHRFHLRVDWPPSVASKNLLTTRMICDVTCFSILRLIVRFCSMQIYTHMINFVRMVMWEKNTRIFGRKNNNIVQINSF